jgi:hypothetical protein
MAVQQCLVFSVPDLIHERASSIPRDTSTRSSSLGALEDGWRSSVGALYDL